MGTFLEHFSWAFFIICIILIQHHTLPEEEYNSTGYNNTGHYKIYAQAESQLNVAIALRTIIFEREQDELNRNLYSLNIQH